MTSRAGKEVFHHSFDSDYPTLVVVRLSPPTQYCHSQVGVFVNSVPARVKMTVDEIGNLRFKSSPPGEDNLLTHEHLKELNLKQGENAAW